MKSFVCPVIIEEGQRVKFIVDGPDKNIEKMIEALSGGRAIKL